VVKKLLEDEVRGVVARLGVKYIIEIPPGYN
jgi:hypothetical protein